MTTPRFTSTAAYAAHLATLDDSDRLVWEATVANELFDPERYLRLYPDVARVYTQPIGHYCVYGWCEGRSPRPGFDSLWYSATHLADHPELNPLAHYVAVGRRDRLATSRPPLPAFTPGVDLPPTPRRCFLFAGHPDGVVDAAVIGYLAELARHGSVFYRAAGDLPRAALDELSGVTTGAWAGRHGGGEIGSYARLAAQHVGWQQLGAYDEVVLVSDRSFLLRALDDVLEAMAAERCDWWGLLATADPAGGRLRAQTSGEPARTGLDRPVGLVRLAESFGTMFAEAELTDLHLASQFLGLRGPVLRERSFRDWLARAAGAEGATASLRLELELSQLLLGLGHRAATYVPALQPPEPGLGAQAFDLVDAGYPLLDRRLLTDNPVGVDTTGWRERVLAAVPSAPVDLIDEALSVRPLDADAFAEADRAGTPRDDVWAFPVCAFDHTLSGNDRAVFEQVRHDPTITKVVLTRSRRVGLDGANVVEVPLASRKGQELLMRAGFVFVKHGPLVNVPWPLAPTHRVINLWHGIPLKRFGVAAVDSAASRAGITAINRGCHAVITSSAMDSLAMTAAFHPLTVHDMWPTGLPRNDFITCPEERLPEDLRADLDALRTEVGGRRLVLFLPTFKDGQEASYYRFSDAEIERLAKWAEQTGAVFGIREHMADSAQSYSRLLEPLHPIDLSSRRFPNVEVLYRAADALISDYSSCLVDFLLTGRPVVSFAYDYARYAEKERGLFYDLRTVLPGPVCHTFDELAGALDGLFDEPDDDARREYARRRRVFFDHLDDGAAARVVARVRALFAS